jgi:hypothetical protein
MPKIEGEGWGITPNAAPAGAIYVKKKVSMLLSQQTLTVMAQGELEDVQPNVEGRQPESLVAWSSSASWS